MSPWAATPTSGPSKPSLEQVNGVANATNPVTSLVGTVASLGLEHIKP